MADESEMKMEALKKVYADIILNTSKEAAARVMVAERKARLFQQDLVSLKEESLRMLLRLKDHFNYKISEMEARSLNQQKKIEELEAQLCEAEGIIVDLRDELKQVQEKLEIKIRNQNKPLNGHIIGRDELVHKFVPQDNALSSSITSNVSDAKFILVDYDENFASLHPIAPNNKCSLAMNSTNLLVKSHLYQFHASNDDSSSIIMQNKETNPCRDECTQKIHAFERNLSNVKPPSSPAAHHQLTATEAENGRQDPVTEKAYITGNPPSVTEEEDNAHQDHLTHMRKLSNKKRKNGKFRGKSERQCSRLLKTSYKASDVLSFHEACQRMINDNVKSCDEPYSVQSSKTAKKKQRHSSCYKDQAIRSLRRSAGKNARYREAIASLQSACRKNLRKRPLPFLSPLKACSNVSNVQSVEIPIEVVGEDLRKTEVRCASESHDLSLESQNTVSAEEGDGAEIRDDKFLPVSFNMLQDSVLVDVPISEGFGSNLCLSGGSDRLLKFTFHRKRRKNPLTTIDENVVPDRAHKKETVETN